MTPDQLERILTQYQQILANEQLKTAMLTVQLEDAKAETEQLRATATQDAENGPVEGEVIS